MTKETILYIDNSASFLFLCKTFLEASGFQVVAATSGQRGLECFKENSIDAVVSEISMTDMTGIELAVQIKGLNENVPVILFSSSAPVSVREHPCVDGFVQKGDGPTALISALQILLQVGGQSS